MKRFYSHGKLLLSGEYVVLDGAKALALPTKLGQDLCIKPLDEKKLHWEAYDHDGQKWLEAIFDLPGLNLHHYDAIQYDGGTALKHILTAVRNQKPGFLKSDHGFGVKTHLEFPSNWGLGSSSTLISNLARWAGIDPFLLLENTFGGSGYDLACAEADGPILFQIKNQEPTFEEASFNPPFKDKMYFLHLNRKQNSRESIAHYHKNKNQPPIQIARLSEISEQLIMEDSFERFVQLMQEHENILADLLKLRPVQASLFVDFHGFVKSLGGWGGDMVLVLSESDPSDYFIEKGFNTLIPYRDLIL